MAIIGITGFKHVGKSTAAKYLESKGFTRHNFKDAMVQEIKANFPDLLKEIQEAYPLGGCPRLGLKWQYTIDELFTTKPPLMRALMVNYGTDVRRKDNPHYWVSEWIDKVIKINGNIVADDVRFHNEADAVKMGKGIIIRLERDGVTTGGNHASETEQLQIVPDYTIKTKDGDIEDLHRQLDDIIKE